MQSEICYIVFESNNKSHPEHEMLWEICIATLFLSNLFKKKKKKKKEGCYYAKWEIFVFAKL